MAPLPRGKSLPVIAVTVGDASGIGPEIILRAVRSLRVQRACSPLIFCHQNFARVVSKYAKVCVVPSPSGIVPLAKPSKTSGIIAYNAIKAATQACLNGAVKALVTAPLSKESLALALKSQNLGSKNFTGHTELLAHLASPHLKKLNPEMLMVCEKINSVMVSRHLPIAQVPNYISEQKIINTTLTAYNFIKKSAPKSKASVVICALNPHAGDNGLLGAEERIITSAVKKLNKLLSVKVSGPLPADSAWQKIKDGSLAASLIVTMYHDQTMIPLKCIVPEKIINVTAGLPFLRTSPGHGTAFDIAGKNIANSTAMEEAIIYAAKHSNIKL